MKTQIVDHTAAYFAFFGVLAGSVIGAIVSIVSQKATLKAERQRLEESFDHEREMRDLEELRRHLERVNEALEEFIRLLIQTVGLLAEPPEVRDEMNLTGFSSLPELRRRLVSAFEDLSIARRGLRLRVDPDDALRTSLLEACKKASEVHDLLTPKLSEEEPEQVDFRKYDNALQTAQDAHERFAAVCEKRVGVRLPT